MATKTKPTGGTAAAKKKKNQIEKPEKVLREGLSNQKKIYESEGWRFVENPNGQPFERWTASSGSPVFPKLQNESISQIFSFIEKLKSENGEKLRRFMENHRAAFDHGDLPLDWQEKKAALEADDWVFEYDAEKSHWSALHDEYPGTTGVNDFGRLLGIVEKNSGKESLFRNSVKKLQPAELLANDETNLLNIVVSPFEGQKRRRARFTDEEIKELSDSIKQHGVLQPILVRLKSIGEYEIVAGERRFLAAKKAGLEKIPTIIKRVSDQEAFEIQTIENLQRKDPDPLDEAFSYQEYIEKYGMTAEDLSVKFGKPVKFIRGRLRLTNLIPEVLDDVAKGFLQLGHAFEIAKLAPEIQKEALNLAYDSNWENGEYVPDKTEPQTLAELRANIEEDIFLSLKSAKFSLTATNLRDDGLACVKCPERTGAAGNLFEELHDPKNDRCLNPQCFSHKTGRSAQIFRAEKSAELVADGKASIGYQIPIISWQKHNREKVEKNFGETPLVDGEYAHVSNAGECAAVEFGIFVDDGGRFGEVIKICRASDCPKHQGRISSSQSSSSSSVPGEKTDAEKREFYKRKQEIFDIKVGEPVRKKVLAEAAKTFTGNKWIFDDEKWRLKLVERLLGKIDGNARMVIKEILGIGSLQEPEKFTLDQLSKVLFLSIIANEGEMLWGSWRDQKEIIAVGDEFGVDYALLDAKERVIAAPKKFQEAAKDHLGKIERGEKLPRPVFFKLEK